MRKRNKLLTPFFALLLGLVLTACGNTADDKPPSDEIIVGNDWRVTGLVRDSGTITRTGKDTYVLVCVHAEDATFYYDSEAQVLFDFVDYPMVLSGDPWESYRSIDFADRNGDGNSDVAMTFEENSDITLMVWFWNADTEAFVFQPEESSVVLGGEEAAEWDEMNGLHLEPPVELTPFDMSLLDGVWQNALGKTYAFNTELMRVIECSAWNRTLSSGPLYDNIDGCGPYITGDEILYPCLSADGNSFVLFADGNAPRKPGARSTGVFYRDGAAEVYADLENASFGESDGRLWYYDGEQYFALPEGYTLGEDGRAYDRTNKPFAPNWAKERYDPASVWGDNWLDENWGSNN